MMKNKIVIRLNPELQKVIDEARKEAEKAFDLSGMPKVRLNQIAQIKVAQWAKNGRELKSKKKKGLWEDFMDAHTGLLK